MTTWTGEVTQGGLCIASVSGADEEAVRREAFHYAVQYAQDGPVEVRFRFNGPKSSPQKEPETYVGYGGPGRT